MGMSASQVRFLSLQNRKNDVGRQLMTLSNRKMALSRDMNAVALKYTNALNKTVLKWSNDSGSTYQELSYDLMMKPNDYNASVPYIVSTRDGKVVVDNVPTLVGKDENGNYGVLTNSLTYPNNEMTYEYFANKITTAETLDGSTGQIYTTTDGLIAGTANRGAYVVPNGALDYGFENTLRYQIFEELGLVDSSTTTDYKALLTQMYGNQEAYKYGNYRGLLMNYLGNGAKNFNTADGAIVSLDEAGRATTLTLNGVNYGSFGDLFGYIDPSTGTWAVNSDDTKVGCLMGNLALAELALEEYDQWLGEMKEFNLDSTTTFNFTATSGRTGSWTVDPFMSMNNCVNSDGGVTNDFPDQLTAPATDTDGNPITATLFDKSWLSNTVSGYTTIADASWKDIYENNTPVKLMGSMSKSGLVTGFLAGLVNSLEQGSGYIGVEGNTWSFTNQAHSGNEMVKDVDEYGNENGEMISVQDAAKKFALSKTVQYFGTLEQYKNNYGGCGSCHSTEHFYECAADAGEEDSFNGLGRSDSGRCFWHSITHFVGGVFETIAGGVWTALTSVVSLGGTFDGFIHLDTGLVTDGWDNFSDSWQGDGAAYTLDMQNVLKTYLTYYEMYMQAHEDGYNLLLGEGMNSDISLGTTCNDLYFRTAAEQFGNTPTSQSGNVHTYDNGDVYDIQTYNNAGNQMIIEWKGQTKNDDDEWEPLTQTTIKLTTPQTAVNWSVQTNPDGTKEYVSNNVQYDTIVQDQNGNVSYYLGTTLVNINKKQQVQTDSYGGLQIKTGATTFTNKIHAYLTKDKKFQEQLEKDRDDALKAIEEMNDKMKNFFTGKETKLMDFYDAMFLRIAESGWVCDPKVNNEGTGREYLNNKLMNTDYFVTVCREKPDEAGYNYTNKLATNVMKIFEVNDDNAQNRALSKYESEKSIISAKERKVDAMMRKLETEQEVINTELESVQKIVNENIDKTFKIFA